jgi:hypothetical protein
MKNSTSSGLEPATLENYIWQNMGDSDIDETTEITQEWHKDTRTPKLSMFQQYVGPNKKGKGALLSSDVTEAEMAVRSFKSHCRQKIL